MREICLTLPETSEGEHFGDVVFRVRKKIFASCGSQPGECLLVVQLDAGKAARLVESDPRFQRYSRQKDCVAIRAKDVSDWDEFRELVLESYRLNAPALA